MPEPVFFYSGPYRLFTWLDRIYRIKLKPDTEISHEAT